MRRSLAIRFWRPLAFFFAAALAALAAVPSASAVSAFVTVHRAVYCGVTEGEPPYKLLCWRPVDGLTVEMRARGRAWKWIHGRNRGYYDPAPGRILRPGQLWRVRGFWTCLAQRTRLRCTNVQRNGWWVGYGSGSRLLRATAPSIRPAPRDGSPGWLTAPVVLSLTLAAAVAGGAAIFPLRRMSVGRQKWDQRTS